MAEPRPKEEVRKVKTIPGIGLPAGIDYPNLSEISSEQCKDVFWRKEVANAFEIANNGYSFYRIRTGEQQNAIFAKDLSGYWYRLNNETRCFEFLFEGFKDTTDYTRMNLPPQGPTFVGFNYLHQAVFPMNDDGRPILPKDDKGKTIFPFYDSHYPLFPVDDTGAICVPLGDDGKPVFPRIPEEFGAYVPCDITGRVVLPLNENGEPIYPRDEEGNVLMPFIILEDGTRKRAVYCADDGTPILPFHNGEHALEVHEGEVLFQYEYQHKMMMLAQYPQDAASKQRQAQPTELMDEHFYQQHAMQYQIDTTTTTTSTMENPQNSMSKTPDKAKNPSNLLLQQLTFMKKKQEATPTSGTVSASPSPSIPAERPAKPNREKERAERFIPEPSRRNRAHFYNEDHRNRSPPPRRSDPDRRDNKRRDHSPPRRRHNRSRSHTYSPVDQRKRRSRSKETRTNRKKYDNDDESRDDKKSSRRSRKDRSSSSSSSSSSISSSSNSDHDDKKRKEKRHKRSDKSRK